MKMRVNIPAHYLKFKIDTSGCHWIFVTCTFYALYSGGEKYDKIRLY
jgi:hypothetical protein